MSRIGRKPIPIPQNVQVEISDGNLVKVAPLIMLVQLELILGVEQ